MIPGGILIVGKSVVTHAEKFGISLPPETIVATRDEVNGKIPAGSIF
jgi:hypothetical protein